MHLSPKICSFNVVIKSIACGLQHTLFVSESGHVYAMGSNSHGQLGIRDNQVAAKNTPTLVEVMENHVTKVSCGNFHSLALCETGQAYSWGQGKFGALGNGRSDNQYEPNLLLSAQSIIDISAGGHHSGFLYKDGTLFMTGDGSKG
jgi:alpha-tubulin suppressor-like RCC1 family protein